MSVAELDFLNDPLGFPILPQFSISGKLFVDYSKGQVFSSSAEKSPGFVKIFDNYTHCTVEAQFAGMNQDGRGDYQLIFGVPGTLNKIVFSYSGTQPKKFANISYFHDFFVTSSFFNVDYVTCFCAGTRIATETGDVAVENLAIGDRVRTVRGKFKAIKWIGRRSYEGRFIAGQPLMLPVCIKQGALGTDLPKRDLHVSPGHALYIDGVLVPAWLLVNDVTIVQAASVDVVSYFHIELDDHDVVYAEGVAAETFVDDGSREQFHNAADYAALYSEPKGGPIPLFAERIEDGFQLQAIQQRFALRAGVSLPVTQCGVLRGFVDEIGPRIISGWAQCETQPEVPVSLDILVDDRRVARVLANRYRADLRKAGMGSGKHAFRVELPASVSGVVTVKRSEDHRVLDPTQLALAAVA